MPLSELLSAALGPLGALVIALGVIYGSYREWWVPGVSFRRALGRIDKLEAEKQKLSDDKDRIAEVALINSVSAKILAQIQADRAADGGNIGGARV